MGLGCGLARDQIFRTWTSPIAANVNIPQGSLVGALLTDANAQKPVLRPYLADGTMRALGFAFVGRDNTGGAQGDGPQLKVLAITGRMTDANAGGGSAIAQTDAFKPAYGVDNQTCSKLAAAGPCIGMIIGIDPDTSDPVILVDPVVAELLALVGGALSVENAAGTFASVLATKATAARTITLPDASGVPLLAQVVPIPVVLSKHSNGSIAARFTPGFAGKVTGISFSVTDPATTGAKAATFTPAIGGSATTGGALALTSANCTPVGAGVNGSAITAANTFTATDEITVAASLVTAFVEGQGVIYLTLAGN
jgi:hypothetical protein